MPSKKGKRIAAHWRLFAERLNYFYDEDSRLTSSYLCDILTDHWRRDSLYQIDDEDYNDMNVQIMDAIDVDEKGAYWFSAYSGAENGYYDLGSPKSAKGNLDWHFLRGRILACEWFALEALENF